MFHLCVQNKIKTMQNKKEKFTNSQQIHLDSFKSFLGYFLCLSICKIMYPTNYGVLIYFYNFETNEIGNPKVLHPLMKRQGLELLKVSATAAKPKQDFNDGDEAETKTKSQETSCICNIAKKCYGYISLDYGHIWTLYHDMNQSQVVPSICIQLFNKGLIWFVKLFKIVRGPFFTRI